MSTKMHVIGHVSSRHSNSILKHAKNSHISDISNLNSQKSIYNSKFLPNASFPSILFWLYAFESSEIHLEIIGRTLTTSHRPQKNASVQSFVYLERPTARASPVGVPRVIYSTYCKLEQCDRIVCCYAITAVLQLYSNVDVVIGSGRVLIVLAACGRWC